ncbi:hypothetical protein JY419_15155 [Stenotrophomonas maltophilia]|nr:hypothetical protein [Stenotrophomonas maltophilia]
MELRYRRGALLWVERCQRMKSRLDNDLFGISKLTPVETIMVLMAQAYGPWTDRKERLLNGITL